MPKRVLSVLNVIFKGCARGVVGELDLRVSAHYSPRSARPHLQIFSNFNLVYTRIYICTLNGFLENFYRRFIEIYRIFINFNGCLQKKKEEFHFKNDVICGNLQNF